MAKLVNILDLKYTHAYRFHLNDGQCFERTYHGKEIIGKYEHLKVRRLNGQIAVSLDIESITTIEPIVDNTPKLSKRRKAQRAK